MLGEQIGESSGTVTGTRVLAADGEDHRLEVSFRGSGQILGVGITDIGTFVRTMRPGNTVVSQDARVLLLTEDGEMASWTGFVMGRSIKPGLESGWGITGVVRTVSEKLARLNGLATVIEYEADDEGGYRWKAWEWTKPRQNVRFLGWPRSVVAI